MIYMYSFSQWLLIYFLFHCLVRFLEEIDGLDDPFLYVRHSNASSVDD